MLVHGNLRGDLVLRFLGSFRWVTRALLATLVLAFGTDLVGSKGGLATMAGAVDTHTDGLLHTLDVGCGLPGRDPFMGFQRKAILGKQSASTFLLGDMLGV